MFLLVIVLLFKQIIMKYYVLFEEGQYHKLGSIELGPRSIAVFDVETREEGREKVVEIFGSKIYNDGNWVPNVIEAHKERHNKVYVDINSEL